MIIWQAKFRQTTVIMLGLAAFLAGLGLARLNIAVPPVALISIFLLSVSSARRRNLLTCISVIILGLGLGIWRGNNYLQQLEPYKKLSRQTVDLTANVDSDSVYGYQGQLSFDVSKIVFHEPVAQKVPGRISVSGLGENAIYRGDTIRVIGRLTPSRGSRQARISFAQLKIIKRSDSPLESFRRNFVAGMGSVLPEPNSSFALGILLGYRTTLPESTTQALKIVGLTHIIAVSGYNLTIIVRSIRRSLGRLSKYQQLVLSTTLILLFLGITDFSASIVRASLVSGLSLVAWYYGRAFRPLLILLLSGVITAAWNPLYIWSDIGWYLSFLAFFGILIIAPLLQFVLLGNKEISGLVMILLETSAAQLMTAPLGLYIFGQASLISIVSNLVIAPLVPLVMILSLIAGLAGIAMPLTSGWIALPASILLSYILDLVTLFTRVPNALVEKPITVIQMIVIYTIVAIVTVLLSRHATKRRGTITGITGRA